MRKRDGRKSEKGGEKWKRKDTVRGRGKEKKIIRGRGEGEKG